MIALGQDGKVHLELNLVEASHLFSFLMHAKFSEDVRLPITLSPTMRALLDGLFAACPEAGDSGWTGPMEDRWLIDETDDSFLRAYPSFEIIQGMLKAEGCEEQLADALYPYRWIPRVPPDRDIERGKVVVLQGQDSPSRRVGVCVHRWRDEQPRDAHALIAWVDDVDEGPVAGVELETYSVSELRIVY